MSLFCFSDGFVIQKYLGVPKGLTRISEWQNQPGIFAEKTVKEKQNKVFCSHQTQSSIHETINVCQYVMFSDTLYTLPVQNDTEIFDIPVAATTRSDHDRTFGIEILNKRSTAVEGKQLIAYSL